MTRVLQLGNPVLRKVSRAVSTNEIQTAKIKKIIRLMKEILEKIPDGVALAAPQVGHNLRIFVVSPKISQIQGPALNPPKGRAFEAVYINPQIIKRSSRKEIFEEGCLSVVGIYGKIKRAEKVTARALDEKGKIFTRGASGLLAEIFQHEIDHLDGILFVDSATDLRKIRPTKINT